MTEKELRQQVVDKAVSYVGLKESDGSHKKIIDLYNSIKPLPVGYKMAYTDAWCAAFVSAVAQACGVTGIIFPECGCDRMIALYKKAGRWKEDDNYKPQIGDVIFYDWEDSGTGDNTGSSDHVGLVVSVGSKNIKVVEGNISDKVGYRTIAIGGKFIRGFGLPDYASKAGGAASQVTPSAPSNRAPTATSVDTYKLTLPYLRKGDRGELVRVMQIILVHRYGYDTGGVDGIFGAGTRAAVIKYQQANGLEADGEIGPITAASLLKV